MSEPGRWTQMAEVGTTTALRFAGWFHRRFGRRPSLVLATIAGAYFCVTKGAARRASASYLARLAASPEGRNALGNRSKALLVLRHFVEIAISVYDRIVVWSGAVDTLELEHDGSEKLFELAQAGQGALLFGAHLGNLDMMGFVAAEHDLPMNVVVYNENAARINEFLETLEGPRVHVIELRPGSVQAAFEIRARVARGEFVAIMADRTPPHSNAPVARCPFLGSDAPFPLGPFRLAVALGCPAYFVLCLRISGARYRTILRPLFPPDSARPIDRKKGANELLSRYVTLLERFVQRYPLQWFNFYDFWDDEAL